MKRVYIQCSNLVCSYNTVFPRLYGFYWFAIKDLVQDIPKGYLTK